MLEQYGYTSKYFLSHPMFGEKEVTLEEFITAEKAAGFYSKTGVGPATGGFGVYGGVSGRVQHIRIKENQ